MDQCNISNPAHLIRQARKSMPMSEDEVRPAAARHRRTSAPVGQPEPIEERVQRAGVSSSQTSSRQAFRAKGKIAVRTLPSAVSMKIRELEEGWKVVESQKEASCTGWISIEPRGFVATDDLEPASPLPSPREATLEAPAPRSARRSAIDAAPRSARRAEGDTPPLSQKALAKPHGIPGLRSSLQSPRSAPSCTSPRMAAGGAPRKVSGGMQARASPKTTSARASPKTTPSPQAAAEVLALKEEAVNLRESNVGLREKELERRRELEELNRVREAMAEELKQLQESKEEQERAQNIMKDKLVRCRDAVAFAVGSIDELYAQQDKSIRMSTSTESGHGNSGTANSTLDVSSHIFSEDILNAKALAQEAGEEVTSLLDTLGQDADQENSTMEQISMKKSEEFTGQAASRSERTPLGNCNAGY